MPIQESLQDGRRLRVVRDGDTDLLPDQEALYARRRACVMIANLREIITLSFRGVVDGVVYPDKYEDIIGSEEMIMRLQARLKGVAMRLIPENVRHAIEGLLIQCRAELVSISAVIIMMDAFKKNPSMTLQEYMEIALAELEKDKELQIEECYGEGGNVIPLFKATNGSDTSSPVE